MLNVIRNSPSNTQPVFDAIVRSGLKLFANAAITIALPQGGQVVAGAIADADPKRAEALRRRLPIPLRREFMHSLAIIDGKIVDVPDVDNPPAHLASGAKNFRASGFRAVTIVPMMQSGTAIGALSVARVAPGPLSDKQNAILQTFAAQAVIAIENTRLLNELRESLQQQTATAEVLKVISRSTFDLPTVLNTLSESAARLCDAEHAWLFRRDGEVLKWAASFGHSATAHDRIKQHLLTLEYRPGRDSVVSRTMSERKTVQIADVLADPEYTHHEAQKLGNYRTVLGVPLLREGEPIGAIALQRVAVRPFTDKQIELLTTFADQAVIAIANARLLGELRESLQQQTATVDVLKVISRSAFDLQTVLDTLIQSAARLCEADMAAIARQRDANYQVVAAHSFPAGFKEYIESVPMAPGRQSLAGRVILERKPAHILDVLADPEYALDSGVAQRKGGYRTGLAVPLLREGQPIGIIFLFRSTVKAFTDNQIDLATTFAAQAVIAIENTRLLNELRQRTDDLGEALEQQTATSEVLKVISGSLGNLQPVFDAMLANATHLCGAKFASLVLWEGDHYRRVSLHNAPPAFAEYWWGTRKYRPHPDSVVGRVALTRMPAQIEDVRTGPGYLQGDPVSVAGADLGGYRTVLSVPMLKDEELVGTITIYRQEVRLFTDKQIELLQSFAAQAVIAIENTRLLNELRQRTDDLTESLEQQTATSEVLQVINSSPGALTPVFDAMLEKAMHLCEAAFGGLWMLEEDRYVAVALRGVPQPYAAFLGETTLIPGPGTAPYRLLHGERLVHNVDLASEKAYLEGDPQRRALVDLGGARSALQVALRKEDAVLGVITIYRQEVRPFTDKQIELVTNFAAQAVIAIENTRLLNELRESLEQQTATSEILRVISTSPTSVEPVFETIVRNAVALCGGLFANVFRYDGALLHYVASHQVVSGYVEMMRTLYPRRPDTSQVSGRVILSGSIVRMEDALADPVYDQRFPAAMGWRRMLGVPMLRDGVTLGVIVVGWAEAGPVHRKHKKTC